MKRAILIFISIVFIAGPDYGQSFDRPVTEIRVSDEGIYHAEFLYWATPTPWQWQPEFAIVGRVQSVDSVRTHSSELEYLIKIFVDEVIICPPALKEAALKIKYLYTQCCCATIADNSKTLGYRCIESDDNCELTIGDSLLVSMERYEGAFAIRPSFGTNHWIGHKLHNGGENCNDNDFLSLIRSGRAWDFRALSPDEIKLWYCVHDSASVLSAMEANGYLSDLSICLAEDTTVVDINQIPKLPESFELGTDYKQTLASGVLLPDRIDWNDRSIRIGSSENALWDIIPDTLEYEKDYSLRTREQQWQYLRELLTANNYSMHYYILADIYYDKQLTGEFCTYTWRIDGIGQLRVHLHNKVRTQNHYKIWLLELVMDSVSLQDVDYTNSQDLTVIRSGEPAIEWNVSKNRLTIDPEQ